MIESKGVADGTRSGDTEGLGDARRAEEGEEGTRDWSRERGSRGVGFEGGGGGVDLREERQRCLDCRFDELRGDSSGSREGIHPEPILVLLLMATAASYTASAAQRIRSNSFFLGEAHSHPTVSQHSRPTAQRHKNEGNTHPARQLQRNPPPLLLPLNFQHIRQAPLPPLLSPSRQLQRRHRRTNRHPPLPSFLLPV